MPLLKGTIDKVLAEVTPAVSYGLLNQFSQSFG